MKKDELKILITTTPIRPIPTDYPPIGALSVISSLINAGYYGDYYDTNGITPLLYTLYLNNFIDSVRSYEGEDFDEDIDDFYNFIKVLLENGISCPSHTIIVLDPKETSVSVSLTSFELIKDSIPLPEASPPITKTFLLGGLSMRTSRKLL